MARTPRRPTAPATARKPERTPDPQPAAKSAKSATAARPARSARPAGSRPASRPGARRMPASVSAAQTQASAWMAGVRGSGFTLLIMGIMILAVIVLAPSVKTFVEQRAQIAELQRSVDEAKANAQSLDDAAARWSDPAYIRAQARDRLYYVMPGEISYLVLNDVTLAAGDDGAVSDELEQTRTDWVTSLLSSVVVSGTGTQTPAQLDGSTATPTP